MVLWGRGWLTVVRVDSRKKRAGMTIEQKMCSIQQFAKTANSKLSDRDDTIGRSSLLLSSRGIDESLGTRLARSVEGDSSLRSE